MMNFLKKIFSSLNYNSDMNKYLILGIGNIGSEYDDTRHNIGFEIVDQLSQNLDTKFESVKLAQRAEGSFKGKKIIIIKPNNYVNNSGRSLVYWQKKEKVSLENILVVCDDLNLFFGNIKIKPNGTSGGHNGLKDIIAKMANQKDFMRLRIGIGHPGHREMVTGWVLGKAAKEDQEKMDAAVDEAVRCMEILAKDGVLKAQNRLHSFKP